MVIYILIKLSILLGLKFFQFISMKLTILIFIAIFAMIFGAFGAGNASAYGPDAEKGKKAAMKVFMITDTPSTINANATDES